MKSRNTADMMDELAERELIARDKVAYARQLAIDPEWQSVDGQSLPDRYYAHAARMVRQRMWTQRRATAWLQEAIHRRNMVAIGKRKAARVHRVSRLEAALHNLLKTGGACAVALVILYLTTGPENATMVAPLALFLTGLRVAYGLMSRDVL